MDWLETHIRTFVLPGIKTLVDAKGADVSAIKPHKIQVRPAKRCQYPEAGLVLAALSSFGKSFANGISRESDGLFNQDRIKEIKLERLRQILERCDPEIWSASNNNHWKRVHPSFNSCPM